MVCSGAAAPDAGVKKAGDMANELFRKTYDRIMEEPVEYSDVDAMDKGSLKVKDAGGNEAEVEFMWAGFGRRDTAAGIVGAAAALCDPERADADVVNAAELKGKVALAKRGTNSFVDKALRAQGAGASGLVILNGEDTLIKAGGSNGSDNVTIPVVVVKSSDAAALMADGTTVSFALPEAAAGDGEGGGGNGASADVRTLPLLTHRVPLLPHEEMELSIPAPWAKSLQLPSSSTGPTKLEVAVFFSEGDGQVGSIGTLAEVVAVLGAATTDDEEGGGQRDVAVPARRRSGAERVRVTVVGTGERLLMQGIAAASTDVAPASATCLPAPPVRNLDPCPDDPCLSDDFCLCLC